MTKLLKTDLPTFNYWTSQHYILIRVEISTLINQEGYRVMDTADKLEET